MKPANLGKLARNFARVGVLGMLATWLALSSAQSVSDVTEPRATLKASTLLQEQIDASVRQDLPSFVFGAQIYGQADQSTVIEGAAMLRKGDTVIHADRLEYRRTDDLAKASGKVRINRAGNVYQGPLLELHVDSFEGFFLQPDFQLLRNQAHGKASRIDFLDAQRSVIHDATFTTCKRLPASDWLPDWLLRATTLSLDNAQDVGTAQAAVLSFKGLPLLPIPYLTFPLSERRRSGLLPPTLGLDNSNGMEFSQPFYWNIAPNRDATFTPTVMSKRGVNWASELRYLEPSFAGTLHFDWMPADSLRNANRWGLNLSHSASIATTLAESEAALKVSLNRVSDDNYWRDFTRTNASLTQRLLANDATLSWRNGAFVSSLRTLKWQTLQDPADLIVPPFDRLPQLTTRFTSQTMAGFAINAEADYTQFAARKELTGQPNAQRLLTRFELNHPMGDAAGFFNPRLQWHASSYQFDAALKDGAMRFARVVPTFSLDGGLVFERDTQWGKSALLQTLEPRVFYVNTPYREQNLLPNYDSGIVDFNLATIYSENAFVGNDRISDSNLLTVGVTSRWLDPASGVEAARLGVAQRLRFHDQNVVLPGQRPLTDRISDLLLGGSVRWQPNWGLDATLQFNPHTEQSIRATLGARFNPASYRTVTAAYRYQRDLSEQIELGWQWPVRDFWRTPDNLPKAPQAPAAGRWYSVGRLNYSMTDSKLVDSILGFEYDAGCWLGRIVFERLQTSTITASQRIMFQLEFVGFTRLGVNPMKSLKDNIPNYQNLREPAGTPSRFSNYD